MVKNLPANTGDIRDVDSILGSGSSSGVGNGNPLQYSCLKNSLDRGAWQASVHRVGKTERVSIASGRNLHPVRPSGMVPGTPSPNFPDMLA